MLRSVAFTAVLVAIGLFLCLYIVVSVPAVQDYIRKNAENELTRFFGGKVEISEIGIYPFNELRLHGVTFYTPGGEKCISAGRIGAGISLWELISTGTVEINYAEIISLDAHVEQASENSPLNIDYIIQAFKPKEKRKDKSRFRVIIRNVVIRKSRLSFDRLYVPSDRGNGRIDFNHLTISNLRADVSAPLISDDEVRVDVRRLAFDEASGLTVTSLAFKTEITPKFISLSGFRLRLDNTELTLSDRILRFDGYENLVSALKSGRQDILLDVYPFVPSELSCFYPPLAAYDSPCRLQIDAAGKPEDFSINTFKFEDFRTGLNVSLRGTVRNVTAPKRLAGSIEGLSVNAPAHSVSQLMSLFSGITAETAGTLESLGDISLELAGNVDLGQETADVSGKVETGVGDLLMYAEGRLKTGGHAEVDYRLKTAGLNVGHVLANSLLGEVALESEGNIVLAEKDISGYVKAAIPYIEWKGRRFDAISLDAEKEGQKFSIALRSEDNMADLQADIRGDLASSGSALALKAGINRFVPAAFGLQGFGNDEWLKVDINSEVEGRNIDGATGYVDITGFQLLGSRRTLDLNRLYVVSSASGESRYYTLDSDILKGNISGEFEFSSLISFARSLLAEALPDFIQAGPQEKGMLRQDGSMSANWQFTVLPDKKFFAALKSPVSPGVPVTIEGNADVHKKELSLDISAPYIVQGHNKLIKDTELHLSLGERSGAVLSVNADYPLKNDRARIALQTAALHDSVSIDLGWKGIRVPDNVGKVSFDGLIGRNLLTRDFRADISVNASSFSLGGEEWSISPAEILYNEKVLSVDNLIIGNGEQNIKINGMASADPSEVLRVDLTDVDLNYIFDLLNIDHVDFGGIASGSAKVSRLFTKTPEALTDGLSVRNLAYNGYVLGDAELESHWDTRREMVAINADIKGPGSSSASVRGGVFVTRDSLSFDFGADRLDIRFLQPFMSGFTSSVSGHASGNVKLFGTFSDIDLTGAVHADDITMRVDQTNVYYSGSDSLFFYPGLISIPSMSLKDMYGNKGVLKGEVRHRFLKDPSFSFTVSDIHNLLAYDTDSRLNPRWYGRVFADGYASIRGVPGLVEVGLNVSTSPGSEFTFVLDETEEASEYTFLSFSDSRKENEVRETVVESFEDNFYKKNEETENNLSDRFLLNVLLDVTPAASMNIIMDPKAGDKITANGTGAFQMKYDTTTDDLNIYGKYTLADGWYNFSLQDLILKNFKIESGSSISFNGDPLLGILDITAAYRVNSNLKDLDSSFENDPDLKRTVVPVDALLKVKGDIHAPEIQFDLNLPTVTAEVERKVRSIISTEDMLNRQVIYLLALNRFYTPEYMGAEQGGELASVASSTISSQIQNIIGSLTDKFTLAPSFKSEKSDLSDMEVDVALSSSFFDNRLLLNGNLGYRDKSSSQTTFIGDFDLEYLLSRDGRLRLKAYNHFNDASYYLKSALTTQGLGIVYRKDFDDPFKFLKGIFRRKNGRNTRQSEKKN